MTRQRGLSRAAASALALATGAIPALLLAPRPALAIPAFARQYRTSCQTCHVAYPKLTPFGEAFRRNGYRYPGGRDEDYRKQEHQKLGADAYKDVFPKAVWPGKLPRSVPLAVVINSVFQGSPESDPKVNFSNVGGSVSFNAATNLGETLSVWGGVSIHGQSGGGAEAELERAFVVVKPMEEPVLNIRVGRIEPGILSFSSHRTLGPAPFLLSTQVKDNQFALEPAQLGLELTGVFGKGRATYTAGLVEGAGNQVNTPKDVYGRIAYKFGGMRLDGEPDKGELKLSDPQPWREWSVQVGAFAYGGSAQIGDPASAAQDDNFFLVGGDVNLQLRDANLVLAYAYGRNDRPLLADPLRKVDTRHLYAQLDYVVYPWLIPMLRWERRDFIGEGAHDRIIPGVYMLVRANVRTLILARIERMPGGSFELTRVEGGLSFAF